jgi:chromosome segregation ATPase
MRILALFIAAIALTGCATGSRRVANVVHAKPDVSVISRPVSAARASNTRASESVAEALARVERAAANANAIAERGTTAGSAEATQVALDLEQTRASLFRAQAELRETAQKLDVADFRIAELDKALDSQTRRLNLVEAELAELLTKNAELTKANAQLRRAAWWSKLKSWGVGIGMVALLVLGFAFKVIGAGARIAAHL